MDRAELDEVQHPETWTDEAEGARPAVKAPRAVVSVAFSRDDFQQVAASAKQHGMKTSEFIRRATLERVSSGQGQAVVVSISGAVRTATSPSFDARPKVEITTPPEPVRTTT